MRVEHLKPEIVLTGVEPTTVVTNAAFVLIGDGVLRKLPVSSPPLG